MKAVLYANILTVIGQLFAFFASTRKRKDEILRIQILSMLLMSVASFLLKGYSAIVMDGIAITRNILSIHSISFPFLPQIFIVLAIVLGSLFNSNGLVGYLPILANVSQSLFVLNKKTTGRQLKFVFAFVSACWAVYNYAIRSYAGALFDGVNCFSYVLNGLRNKEEKE